MLLRTSVGGMGMVEFYANDVMSHPYTMNPPVGAAYGSLSLVQLTNGAMAIDVKTTTAWRMTLAAY